MKFSVKKHFGKLVPVYNSDAEKLRDAKLKEGEVYQVDITKPRNYEFHKKYFALIALCYDNQDMYSKSDDLREELIIESGYYYEVPLINGGTKKKAKSISFSKMDNIEFEQLYKRTIDTICKFLKVESEDLMSEIVEYM